MLSSACTGIKAFTALLNTDTCKSLIRSLFSWTGGTEFWRLVTLWNITESWAIFRKLIRSFSSLSKWAVCNEIMSLRCIPLKYENKSCELEWLLILDVFRVNVYLHYRYWKTLRFAYGFSVQAVVAVGWQKLHKVI